MKKTPLTFLFAFIISLLTVPTLLAQSPTIRVGLYQNEPLVFTDEAGIPQGIFPDILNAIAAQEKWQIEYVKCAWSNCLELLAAGDIDLLAAIAYSEERDEIFDFTQETIISNWGQIYTPRLSDIQSILDLEHKRIAVLENDIHASRLEELLDAFDLEATLVLVEDYHAVFQLTAAGEVDAGVVNRLFALQHESAFAVHKTSIIFNPLEVRFAIPAGRNAALIQAIDKNLAIMRQDQESVYYQSINRWYGTEGETVFVLPDWLKWGIGTAVSIALLFMATSVVFRQQVQARTAELRRKNKDLQDEVIRRQQAEAEIARLATVIEQAAETVLITDLDGGIVYVNPYVEKATGYTVAEISGQNLRDLYEHCDQGDQFDELWQTITDNKIWRGEFCSLRKDGRSFYERTTFFPITNIGGQVINYAAVKEDITQEKEYRKRLLEQERLAAVGQLAAGIAHDFNNIMTVILLYAQLARRTSELAPKVEQRLFTIEEQAKLAANLIQQILDFSRRAVLEKRPLALSPFLKEIVKLLRRTLPENIEFELAYGPNQYTVDADPTRIQQAIMNLALNARDAMPNGGRIHVQLDGLRVDEDEERPLPEMPPNDYVTLTISDTGTGITSDILGHIYEPFFTTKGPGKGSGLGLAQVYGIVTQHGGYIDVQTEIDKGTTFTIYLPASPLMQDTAQRETAVLETGEKETILLVEDNQDTRNALLESLSTLNYQVIGAVNGQEALDLYDKHQAQIALVLSDIVMPVMGGRELLNALRQRRADIPVVMMTGHPMGDQLDALMAEGMTDWLLKPLNLDALAQMLARLLETRV